MEHFDYMTPEQLRRYELKFIEKGYQDEIYDLLRSSVCKVKLIENNFLFEGTECREVMAQLILIGSLVGDEKIYFCGSSSFLKIEEISISAYCSAAYDAWCDVLDGLDVMMDVVRRFNYIFSDPWWDRAFKILQHSYECILSRTCELEGSVV